MSGANSRCLAQMKNAVRGRDPDRAPLFMVARGCLNVCRNVLCNCERAREVSSFIVACLVGDDL